MKKIIIFILLVVIVLLLGPSVYNYIQSGYYEYRNPYVIDGIRYEPVIIDRTSLNHKDSILIRKIDSINSINAYESKRTKE